MIIPNLLQFVPNKTIAKSYLKTNFYLKDATFYRKSEKQDNLKFDDSEGRTKNWSISPNCLFISCFTQLKNSNFKNGVIKKQFVYSLIQGNVDDNGKKIERPFITISEKKNHYLMNYLRLFKRIRKITSLKNQDYLQNR